MKLNLKTVKATNEVFKRLNILRRWTSFVTEDRFNELSKQSLNCIVAYLLASYAEKAGNTIKWERFPKIALYRAYQKAYVYFDTPEHIIEDICEIGEIPKNAFNDVTREFILENTNSQFTDFLCECIGTYELRIYRAATKIATYIEVSEISYRAHGKKILTKIREIISSIHEFDDIPGIEEIIDMEGNVFEILQMISSLRNKNRWASYAYGIECSVLGHLFDTAVFAYFMSLEDTADEQEAAKAFFMGVFHDIAEAWTTDIPSPIKDRIPGFRKATELYELKVLSEEVYYKVPEFLAIKLKEVMFEDEANKKYKKLLKGADYLSADSECWRQCVAGSRDVYFRIAIEKRVPKIKDGSVLLTPVCGELFEYFMDYAKKTQK